MANTNTIIIDGYLLMQSGEILPRQGAAIRQADYSVLMHTEDSDYRVDSGRLIDGNTTGCIDS